MHQLCVPPRETDTRAWPATFPGDVCPRVQRHPVRCGSVDPWLSARRSRCWRICSGAMSVGSISQSEKTTTEVIAKPVQEGP